MNHWNHIAVVYNGPEITITQMATIKIYLNGVLKASNVVPNTWTNPFAYGANTKVNLGQSQQQEFGQLPLTGALDEVKIWGTARTQAQVLEDMSTPVANPAANPDLLLYYDFDNQGVAGADNTGSPIAHALTDRASLGINGTLNGFNFTGNTSNWVGSYTMVAPNALAATNIGSRGFTANWTPPTVGIADSFKITVATDADFIQIVPGCDSLAAAGTATSLPITGLAGTTTYYYRVRAYIAIGEGQGNYSNTISAVTTVATQTPPGNALNFNGSSYVSGKLATDVYTEYPISFTIEAWVKPGINSNLLNILSIGDPNSSSTFNAFSIAISNSALVVQTAMTPTTLDSRSITSLRLPTNHWNHIAVVYNAGSYITYVNGIVVSTRTLGGILGPFYYGQNTVVNIGKSVRGTNGVPFVGSIDEVKIWTIARTQQELLADMTGPVLNPASNPNLALYYDFDGQGVSNADNTSNPTAGTLTDHAQYGIHGILSGFGLTGTTGNWVPSYAMTIPTVANATDTLAQGFTAHWTAPVLNNFDGYKVMVGTDVRFTQVVPGYDSLPAPSSATSLAITGLQPGIQYYYSVRASKASVLGEGAYSGSAGTKTIGVPVINSFTPTFGHAGTMVTISGANLNFATAVNFGGTTATSFNIVSENTITAIIGSGTSGILAVTNPAGTGASSDIFTLIEDLGVTSILPTSAATGNAITIQGTGFTGATAVSFGGTKAASFTVVNDNVITAIVGIGTGGDVIVSNGTAYTLPAAFTYIAGPPAGPNTALHFDGNDDYVRIPGNPLSATTSPIISFWIKTTQIETGDGVGLVDADINGNSHDWGIYLKEGKVLFSIGPDGTLTSSSSINTGQWTHVAVVRAYNQVGYTTLSIFINGRLDAQTQVPATAGTLADPTFFVIGSSTGLEPGRFFNGSIDELRFSSGGIDYNNIASEMTSFTTLSTTLLAAYHFDQGVAGANNSSTNWLIDYGTNNFSGPLSNFALTGNTSNWVESYAMVIPVATPATHVNGTGFTANWILPTLGVIESLKVTVATDPLFTHILPAYNNLMIGPSATSLVIAGLDPLTPYYYRVQADKASINGTGAYAAIAKVVTASTSFSPPGNALRFDGVNDYVRITNPLSKTFTMQFWIKPPKPEQAI